MRGSIVKLTIGFCLLILVANPARAGVNGDYLEVRSADVYTGPCFANAEVGLVGNQAILAWRIREGSWNGIDLKDLTIVAVVKASATLGDPFHSPYPAQSVLIVQEKTTLEQRKALVNFARAEVGQLLENIVRVEAVPIKLEVGIGRRHGQVRLDAGALASVHTRALNENDHLCGNERIYYPPLAELRHRIPAVSLLDRYQGKGLGVTWSRSGKRNAFVGTFSR